MVALSRHRDNICLRNLDGVHLRLKDKTAIVFAGGPNIGGTVAAYFAREGAHVVVSDIDETVALATAQYLRSLGGDAIGARADVLVEADVANVVRLAREKFGGVDVAFNLAGSIYWSSIIDADIEAFRKALLSFPLAGMLVTKHVARAMIAGGTRGSIIHLLSTAAHFGEASAACYTASKAALLNLARSAAMDLAHDGIRVNTITPCAMEHQLWTLMKDEVDDPDFERPARRSFYSRDDYLKMIPLERFPRASDVASVAIFLASDESSFITGVDIPVDGGLRYKYPAWRPGDYTGVNIKDYISNTSITEYGLPVAKLEQK
jgi:NAD(P)-dependent dehydrogenase (short-subunit alcohol dehydrogenase family)